ncbi:putative Protein kinase domain-containing protein [Seiridium cardinale]
MSSRSTAAVLARRRRYFESQSRIFEFDRVLGAGGHGDAYVFREVQSGTEKRKFVAKYSTSDARSIAQLQTEIRIARKLYGAMHVSQPIVDDGAMRTLRGIPASAPMEDRFVLFTEFLPGLTLERFIANTRQWDVVPNRVLWMIFLCLVKMCIAMAFPPDKPYGQITEHPESEVWPQVQVEEKTEVKSDDDLATRLGSLAVADRKDQNGQNKSTDSSPPKTASVPVPEPTNSDGQIYHGDMDNFGNFVFGDFDPLDHWLVPILKAIDFGLAIDSPGANLTGRIFPGVSPGTFTQANIYYIGRAMQNIYGHSPTADPTGSRPNLDMEIYELAGRCAHRDHTLRPPLAGLLATVQNAVNTKTNPEHFPGKPYAMCETDDYIRTYLWSVLFSAS